MAINNTVPMGTSKQPKVNQGLIKLGAIPGISLPSMGGVSNNNQNTGFKSGAVPGLQLDSKGMIGGAQQVSNPITGFRSGAVPSTITIPAPLVTRGSSTGSTGLGAQSASRVPGLPNTGGGPNQGTNPNSGITLNETNPYNSGATGDVSGGTSLNTSNSVNTTGMKAPAGMEYNGLGQLVPIQSQQSAPSGPDNSYRGLVNRIAQQSSGPSESYLDAQKKALGYQDELLGTRKSRAEGIYNTQNAGTPMSQALGQAGAINNLYAAREGALASAFQGASSLMPSATAQQSAQISGLQGAAGLAAPQQVGYGSQYLDPTTGQPIGGGASAGSSSFISDLADQVASGTAYNDAVSQLPNPAMASMLLQAIRAKDPNFDITQSNARAQAQAASTMQTGTIGGQLQKSAETVKQHMDSLQTYYDQLKAQSGLPLLNAGINAVAGALGSGALTSYEMALANVRDELAKILGGGQATEGSSSRARAVLPDNMTPSQIKAAIATATELMNSKIQEYTRTDGGEENQNGTSSSDIFSW